MNDMRWVCVTENQQQTVGPMSYVQGGSHGEAVVNGMRSGCITEKQ